MTSKALFPVSIHSSHLPRQRWIKQGGEHHRVWLPDYLERCRFLRHSPIANHKRDSMTERILQAVLVGKRCKQSCLSNAFRKSKLAIHNPNPNSSDFSRVTDSKIIKACSTPMRGLKPNCLWDWVLSKHSFKRWCKNLVKILYVVCNIAIGPQLLGSDSSPAFGIILKNVLRQVDSICSAPQFCCTLASVGFETLRGYIRNLHSFVLWKERRRKASVRTQRYCENKNHKVRKGSHIRSCKFCLWLVWSPLRALKKT